MTLPHRSLPRRPAHRHNHKHRAERRKKRRLPLPSPSSVLPPPQRAYPVPVTLATAPEGATVTVVLRNSEELARMPLFAVKSEIPQTPEILDDVGAIPALDAYYHISRWKDAVGRAASTKQNREIAELALGATYACLKVRPLDINRVFEQACPTLLTLVAMTGTYRLEDTVDKMKLLAYLVKQGARDKVLVEPHSGKTLLMEMCTNPALEAHVPGCLEALLEAGANLNAQDREGNTVLHNAILSFSVESLPVVRFLVSFGVIRGLDPTMTNKRGDSPRDLVDYMLGDTDEIRYLEELLDIGVTVIFHNYCKQVWKLLEWRFPLDTAITMAGYLGWFEEEEVEEVVASYYDMME